MGSSEYTAGRRDAMRELQDQFERCVKVRRVEHRTPSVIYQLNVVSVERTNEGLVIVTEGPDQRTGCDMCVDS